MANPQAAPTRFAQRPVIEPESQIGTLRDAADRLRLLRSLRLRPQFGISSAVGAALLASGSMLDATGSGCDIKMRGAVIRDSE
jgi:hypothetical protein